MADVDLDTGRHGDPEGLELLLDHLRRTRGFDFTGYKRTTLSRRVDKRMLALGIERHVDYIDRLEVDPEEFTRLFNTILINVTSFFRDPSAWEYLTTEIIPRILAGRGPGQPIRVWSAGCAQGAEAYTIAMCLAEVMGPDELRDRVKIYATDIDEEALSQARQAHYSAHELEGLPDGLLERYFERNGSGYAFRKDLRRSVIFGRHDLIRDAPISRIDLLVCRNTLMYLNVETQANVLAHFNFALRDGGYLLLGKAEMLVAHADLFTAVDLKRRVFRKAGGATLRERLLVLTDAAADPADEPAAGKRRLSELAFQNEADAQVIVDAAGTIALANAQAMRLFRLAPADVGRPLKDLELSYRPVELRSRVQQVHAERTPWVARSVEWPRRPDGPTYVDVQVTPLIDDQQTVAGVSVVFTDVSRYRQLQEELEHANRGLEDAFAELQSTNEELETTNEELQSTIEELETTNEELQSTNEELETMNEELQSGNEELQTINDDLSVRTTELDEVNAFLESILTSLRGGVMVLDNDLVVQVWNHRSEDQWGLRGEEVQGQHFLNLDMGLPLERLRTVLRTALSGEPGPHEIVLDAVNRRGRPIRCRVTCTPLRGSDSEIRGVILLTEELEPER